ncbi:MAG: tetratricopeptide repeat protein [Pyrinomonadaceae bacterium]|nr:tetratricopeptide repeat protein [Pyrinomonadaceae bacterium]
MKKYLIISLASLISIGCGGAAQQTATTTTNANTAVNALTVQTTTSNQAIVSSHSNDAGKTALPSGNTPAGESPMAKPIDVATMTADIEKAEQEYKKNPKTKNELARAYFVRATVLTGAAQYRAALGDYRKGLKLDPTDESAKKMHDEIISIFKQLNREPPKEGEESAPMPIK